MTRILSGTATVVAGDRTVTFDGPPLSDANCPVDGSVVLAGAAYFIASRTDTGHFELTRDYEGTDGTVSCEIDPLNANAINLAKVARQITEYNAKLALTDAYGKGLFYECLGFTGANDPGPGKLARNAAAWSDTTEIYMDVLDAGGHEQGALIDLARAGTAYIVRSIDTGAYAAFMLSAAPANMGPDEWRKISLAYVDGDGIIADGELVAVEWNRKGEQGDSFTADAEVDTLAERDAFDDEAAGFVLKVNDVGDGRAAFYTMGTGGAADWGAPAYLTGSKGDKGNQGDKGWSPQLGGETDGDRRVLRLVDYVGGAGSAPTANVGDYLKADGTFTADIAEAMDIRGAPGINGAGTVAGIGAGAGIEVDDTDPANPVVSGVAFTGDGGMGGELGAVPAPAAGDAAAGKVLGAGGGWVVMDAAQPPEQFPVVSNNVGDATNDLDFSAAAVWDSTRTVYMVASAMTKRADAAWAAGSGNGGRFFTTLGNTLHLYQIHDPVNDLTDYGFSDSPSNPTAGANYPAAYTKFRRVGSIPRESGAIIGFVHDGVLWQRKASSPDLNNATNFGTAALLATLAIPDGLRLQAQVRLSLNWNHASSAAFMLVSDPAVNDETPSSTNGTVGAPAIGSAVANQVQAAIMTNQSRQVRYRTNINGTTLFASIRTIGWIDTLS